MDDRGTDAGRTAAGADTTDARGDSPPRPQEWKLPDLRWYQTEALAAWEQTRRGVLALPTGSGKTIAAISAIAKLAVTALILVPTRVLLDQWVQLLERLSPYPIGHIGDGERKIEGITVTTFASAVIWAPKIGDQFSLVVVDEAHHVGAWCQKEILEMLPAPYRLGLTATPPSVDAAGSQRVAPSLRLSDGTALDLDDADVAPRQDELTRTVGPVVYSVSIDELRGSALADFELITVPIELAPDERTAYRENRAKFSSVFAPHQRATHGSSWQDFVRDARRTRAGRDALNSWRSYRQLLSYSSGKRTMLRELLALHAGQRTLIFTADVATAYAIAKELLVQPITHEIGKAERADVLARFRTGEISALVSAQVLDEGLDVPDADVAIIVGGSGSARRHVQRIGRVLRPREGKRARIYELAVNDSTEVSYVARRRAGLGERAAEVSLRNFEGGPRARASEPKRRSSSPRRSAASRQCENARPVERAHHDSVDSDRVARHDSVGRELRGQQQAVGGDELPRHEAAALPSQSIYRYPLLGDLSRASPARAARPYPDVGELLVAMNLPFPAEEGAA